MSLEFEGYFPAKDAIWTFCSSCAMSVSVLRIVSLERSTAIHVCAHTWRVHAREPTTLARAIRALRRGLRRGIAETDSYFGTQTVFSGDILFTTR
jgi:hypothetical protein